MNTASLPQPPRKTATWYSLTLKKYGYLMFLLPLSLPLQAWWGAQQWGFWDAWAWLVPLVFFGWIPLVDALIGQDPANPAPEDEAALNADRYYQVITLACLPLYLAVLVFGVWVMATAPFGVLGYVGWIVSLGCVGGVTAINTGHELIHKTSRLESTAGGLLLACVGYGSFKVEHVWGHHVNVSTPADGSSAPLGDNAYAFIARALRHNVACAYRLERANAERRGTPWAWWRSELNRLAAFTVLLAAVCTAIGGALGLVFFVGHCLVAVALLEVINFIEHYGLARQRMPDGPHKGRYEKVNPTHSWNSNFVLTNLFLFQLQRHSDHHANAVRRYQVLRHFDESPQLPAGYATMVVLALLPWAWRRVMDPKVAQIEQARALAAGR
jgi:alkane 1-monooxygenase